MSAIQASDAPAQARALGNRTRHDILRHLAAAERPLGVAELAERFGVHHNAVRRHLARLERAGLVVATAQRGPRPGRPRLAYRATPRAAVWDDVAPYERLARWLTRVVATGSSARDVGRDVGAAEIVPAGGPVDAAEALAAAMRRQGFGPSIEEAEEQDGGDAGRVTFRLSACPYAAAAASDPDVVCELHRGLAEGMAAATGGLVVDDLVVADPYRAGCRLRTHRPGRAAEPREVAAP